MVMNNTDRTARQPTNINHPETGRMMVDAGAMDAVRLKLQEIHLELSKECHRTHTDNEWREIVQNCMWDMWQQMQEITNHTFNCLENQG